MEFWIGLGIGITVGSLGVYFTLRWYLLHNNPYS